MNCSFRMFSNEDVTIGAWMLAMNVNHEDNRALCEPECTQSSIAVWDIPKCSGWVPLKAYNLVPPVIRMLTAVYLFGLHNQLQGRGSLKWFLFPIIFPISSSVTIGSKISSYNTLQRPRIDFKITIKEQFSIENQASFNFHFVYLLDPISIESLEPSKLRQWLRNLQTLF